MTNSIPSLYRLDVTVKSAPLDPRSIEHRREMLKMLEHAQRGHVGSALSVMEIVRVLYDDILRFDPRNPRWADRDRFIFSKGHGCLALYEIGRASCRERV